MERCLPLSEAIPNQKPTTSPSATATRSLEALLHLQVQLQFQVQEPGPIHSVNMIFRRAETRQSPSAKIIPSSGPEQDSRQVVLETAHPPVRYLGTRDQQAHLAELGPLISTARDIQVVLDPTILSPVRILDRMMVNSNSNILWRRFAAPGAAAASELVPTALNPL